MTEKSRIFFLIFIMISASLLSTFIALRMLYHTAYQEVENHLVDTARTQARMIEAIARFDAVNSPDFPGGPGKASISQIVDAYEHLQGFGRTGEFTLARSEEDRIVFLLSHRHLDLNKPQPVSIHSNLAEPMKLSLSGKSGTIVGPDYRGVMVMAAHEPVDILNLGIVVKKDLAEIRAPFIKSGILAGGICIALILVGSLLFFRITRPIIAQHEKRAAEMEAINEELKNSEARFRAIFEQAAVGVAQIETVSGRFIRINQKYRDIVGYSENEMSQSTFMDITVPIDLQHELKYMGQLKAGTIREFTMEKRYFRKNGDDVWVNLTVSPMWKPGDTPDYHIAIVEDITERKHAQKEKKLLESQLRQQQKMESIGTLAGGVAHEINNPINGVMNYAQLIIDKSDNEDPIIEYATEIITETNRVAEIVKNLLSFARQDKRSHSPARMTDIIHSTLSLIKTIIKHDQITLEIDIPEDLPKIKCRSQQIQQVLMNLITNARDALNDRYPDYHEDKKLRIAPRLLEKDGRQWIQITLEDHGTGIREDISDRIFDPFFTTKPKETSTGLGLAISYGIIQEHHGQLYFETKIGKFTRFYVELPLNNGGAFEK